MIRAGKRRTEMTKTILVVDDDPHIRDVVIFALEKAGMKTLSATNGTEALSCAAAQKPDLVVLDISMPEMDGLDVCRRLRKNSDLPVLFLSSRDEEIDRIIGLEIGGDDYVTKPYSARELIARIRAVMRRNAESDELIPDTVSAGPVRMDVERHVVSVDGTEITMPLKEFDLLEMLLRNAGRVMTRGQLIDRVWGPGYVGDTKTLDVHIKRLRSKIEPDPSSPRFLMTVRGLGYKFEG